MNHLAQLASTGSRGSRAKCVCMEKQHGFERNTLDDRCAFHFVRKQNDDTDTTMSLLRKRI